MKFKVLGTAIGAIVFSLALSSIAQTVPTIVIHAKRFAFVPDEITLKQGVPVKLVVISDDVAHSLRIDGLNVDLKEKPGQTAEAVITPEQTGDFKGRCGVFCGSGHGKMLFTVHVVGK